MADDLGQEWISAYGVALINTPNIDELAETGLKFNGAYSVPKCTPSRVTLLTAPSQTPWQATAAMNGPCGRAARRR